MTDSSILLNHQNIINFLKDSVDKTDVDIRTEFDKVDLKMKDIYYPDFNQMLLKEIQDYEQKSVLYNELLDFLKYLYLKKTRAYSTRKSIHPLEALEYKAHNQLDIKHSSESYALDYDK